MTDAERTLANVLADAIAHHEASDLESLVSSSATARIGPGPILDLDDVELVSRSWIDFERAGAVAAAALVEIPAPPGWDGPTPLFTFARVDPTTGPPPADAVGDDVATSDDATADTGAPSEEPLPGEHRELLERVLVLAREVMPTDAMRHTWLADELGKMGRPIGVAGGRRYQALMRELERCAPRDLLELVERLGKWRDARARNARRRGLAGVGPEAASS